MHRACTERALKLLYDCDDQNGQRCEKSDKPDVGPPRGPSEIVGGDVEDARAKVSVGAGGGDSVGFVGKADHCDRDAEKDQRLEVVVHGAGKAGGFHRQQLDYGFAQTVEITRRGGFANAKF